ncbi:MAG TPA: hypothetical protein PK566_13425, partial [Pseudobacteroides sp.]|nr:hypothetical protein [Pseudobacteroides sp.]
MLRYKNYIFFLLLIFSFNISSSQVIWRDSTGYIADTVYVDTTAFNLYGPFQYAKPTTASFLYLAPTFPNLSVPGWNNAIHNYQDKSFPYQSSPPYFNYNGVLYNPYDSRIFTDSLYGKLIGKLPENFLNGEVWIGAPVLNKPIYYRGGDGTGAIKKWKYAFFPYYKFPLYRNEDTVGVVFPDSLFFGGGISDSSVVADVIKINDTTLQVKRKAHIYNKGHYIRRTRLDSFLVSLSSSYYTYNNYYFDTTINNNYYNIDTNYYISNYYIDTNYYYTIYNIDTNIYIYQIDTNIYVTNNYYTANPDTFVTGIYAYIENDSLKIEITRSQGAPMLFTSTKIEQMKKHGINDTTWHTGYPLNIWNGGTNFNAYDPYTHFQMLMKYDQETQQIKPTDILARDTWVKNGQSINYYTKNGYWRMYGATAGDLLRFDYYNDYGIFFTPDNMIGCNGLHIFDWSKNYCGGIYADTSALSIDVNRYKYIFNYGKISNVRPAEANGEVVVFEQLPNVSGLDTSVRIVESIKVGSDTSIYYTSSIYTFRTGLLKKITPLLPDTIIRAPGNEISTPPKRLAWSNIIPNKKEYYMGYVYLMGDCEECNKTLISKTPTTSIKIRLDNIGQESGHYRVYIDSVIEGKTVIKGFDKSGVLFDGTEQEFNVELKDPEIIDINGQSKDLTNGGPLAYYLKGYVIDSTTQNGIQITDFKVYISTKKSNTTTPPIIPPTTGGWGGTDDDYYYSMPYSFWLGFASKKYTGEGLSGGDLDPEYFDENCEGWIVKWKAHTVFPSSSSSPGYGSDCNADNLWVTVDDEEAPMNDFTDPVDLCFIKAIKPAIKFGSSCMRLEVWFIHNEIPYSAFNVIYYPNQSNYKISNQTPDNGIPTEPEQIDTVKMIKHLINDTTWHFGFPLTIEHGGTNNTNFSNTIDNQTYNFIAYDPTNNRFIRTPYNYSNIVQASSDTVIAIIDTNVIATKYYVDSKSNTA